jgi:predicted ATPase/DNA-binding winged helix-turn-helix (wHTH) protein
MPAAPWALRFGAFVLDESQGRLMRAGHEIMLAPRPFALLCCLVRHANQLLGRDALLDAVWGHRHVSAGVLKSAVHVLREALGDDGRSDECRIESVPRRGYRLVARVEPVGVQGAAVSAPLIVAAPSLIGRASELQRLAELTAEHRVVTVIGPGGVGKTCLVRQWLAQQGGKAPAVGWCDLATISDPALAAAELARALQLDLGSSDPVVALCRALRTMTMRIVLDNVEHLVDGVARLAEAIVREAPGARLVVTSQLPLRVAEERLLPIGPLSMPPVGSMLDPVEVRAFGAVDLFARRAEAADPRFQWNAEAARHTVDIVRRLDGLPLALEMAAARLPMFGMAGLADALARRLDVLTLASRTAPARQQTLRTALEWSHGLLTDAQRQVLRRLSVFVGPFTLESAQDLSADADMDRWQVLDALGELVDRSMIVADGRPRRFRWLESPRAFAAERLTAAGEAGTWRARHAHVVASRFGAIAAAAYDGSSRLDDALAALRPELPDAREAMHWALEHEPATAVALMAPFNFAAQRDGWAERRRLWEATAAHVTSSLPQALRARWSLGACRFWGDQPAAARHGADAAELCRQVGDLAGLHRALWAQVAVSRGTDPAREAQWLAELATIRAEQLPAFSRFQGHYFEGSRLLQLDDASGAIANYRQALAFAVEAGDSVGALDVRIGLAELELAAGDAHAAIALARELVRQLDGTRHRFQLSYTWLTLAAAWLVAGDLAEARIAAAEAWALSDEGTLHFLCDHAAWLAAVEARPGDAARLLGAADTLRATRSRGERGANEARAFERAQRMARGHLGETAFRRLRDEGSDMPPREVQRIALRATERDSAYIALPGVS